jgi:hypothetical protein
MHDNTTILLIGRTRKAYNNQNWVIHVLQRKVQGNPKYLIPFKTMIILPNSINFLKAIFQILIYSITFFLQYKCHILYMFIKRIIPSQNNAIVYSTCCTWRHFCSITCSRLFLKLLITFLYMFRVTFQISWRIANLRSFRVFGFGVYIYTLSFKYPHKKSSIGLQSGKCGGYSRSWWNSDYDQMFSVSIQLLVLTCVE